MTKQLQHLKGVKSLRGIRRNSFKKYVKNLEKYVKSKFLSIKLNKNKLALSRRIKNETKHNKTRTQG